ncbi:zinc finger protein Xfin-like [Mytilus californianus]|uniref:zinc finger protein Xfin-like n=1 Tax=Mytilus californianus TaxID=6549 RepID=UPI002246FB69|nr:zinc finger protein Xfin-like [Mytilus californianus]
MKIHAVHCKVCHFANCRCHLQKYSPKGEFAASKNILRKFLVKQTEIKPDKHSVNSTMDNVSNHLSNDQEPKRTETCGICCKEFKGKKVFLIHMRTHTGEQPYKCDICFKGFIGETKLQLHMRTHTGEKPYKCDICCKAFGRRTSLTRHRNIHHGHPQSQIPKRDIRINAASKNKLQEYFRKNNGKTPDKSGVDMHFRNVVDNGQDPTGTKTSNEQNICVVNDKSFSLDKQSLLHVLPKRKETSDNLPFTCKICDKGFKGKLRLQVHMRTHTGETPYKCDICFKGFTHRCTLANHMKIHADHCNVCDFANCRCHLQKYSPKTEFAASKNILRKFLVKQTEIKPDKHGVNNTMANVSNHLSNDQEPTRTETENEQFICGVCGEIFSGDTILVLHMKKHACDITNTMANDRNDISNDHDHTISNTDQDNHDHTISYNDQHHHDNHDHDDHTNFNTDQEFTISYNEQDHHDHTISNTDQDYTILNTDQEFTISYNDQDHHDHPISNTDQDHTILNTDQVFIISKNDQHLQDHTILKTDQEFTISKNDQHHHDHPISNTDQDHTILNTDQEFTISKNDQHHHDHTISNIKIEQFLCGVCRKSFSEENKLRLHTKITHKSLLSVIT